MEDNNTFNDMKKITKRVKKYLKKNLSVITWITTAFIAAAVAILKFIRFVSESGRLGYWRISPAIINVVGDNVLYDIIVTTVFAAVAVGLFLIPYFIIKSKMKKGIKTAIIFAIAAILSLIMFWGSNASEIIENSLMAGIIAFLVVDVIFLLVCFSPTITVLLITKPAKSDSKQLTKKGAVGVVIALSIICIVYFYFSAYYSAMIETSYRITADGYVIIYETDDLYYLAKYDEKNKIILKEHQKVIEKIDVDYVWIDIKE